MFNRALKIPLVNACVCGNVKQEHAENEQGSPADVNTVAPCQNTLTDIYMQGGCKIYQKDPLQWHNMASLRVAPLLIQV